MPATEPGSSIMPGKVNPVIPEALNLVAAQVIGNDAAIAVCGSLGQLELNIMMPVIAYDLLQSIEILANGSRVYWGNLSPGLRRAAENSTVTPTEILLLWQR